MDLSKLRTFRTVGVFLNFSRTAEVLNCAQSTVSTQIKSLEEEIGVPLFKRVKKRVILTAAGEKMLVYANKLLSIEEEALADISNRTDPAGTIRLMVPEAIAASVFPDLIQDFVGLCPTINFEISNCSQSGLENELRTEAVDVAFVFSESVDSLNLHSENITTESLVVVANPKHSLANKKIVDATDLHSQTVLLPKAGCSDGLLFRQLVDTNISKPSSIIEATSIEMIKQCVLRGVGIAVLPEKSTQREIHTGQLVGLNWIRTLKTSVVMIWHKDRRISDVLQHFMQLVRKLKVEVSDKQPSYLSNSQ